MADSREIFARNLEFWLKKRELSETDLATQLGIKRQTVNAWARRVAGPDLRTLGEVAQVLEIPVSDLFYDPNDLPKVPVLPEDEDARALKHIAKRLGRKIRIDPRKNS